MKKSMYKGLVVLSLAALLIVGGTLAWFTASAPAVENKFTAGTVAIELVEEDFPEEGYTNVNPGDVYDKKVYVKSTGSKCTYVRVFVTPDVVFHEDYGFENSNTAPALDNIMKYTINGPTDNAAGWVYGGSDAEKGEWYIWSTCLCGGDETPQLTGSLFVGDEIEFAGSDMGNEYQGATFTIAIEAEAVQASNGAAASVWGALPNGVTCPSEPSNGTD